MSITVEVDSKQVLARMNALVSKHEKVEDKASEDAANEVLRLSQQEVPHDEGTLQNSGIVEEYGGGYAVGYHTVYAARLHEHPEYNFQDGRKGKYLEDPIIRNAQVLGLRITDYIKDNLLDG